MQDVRIGVVQMMCRVGDISGNIARMERFVEKAATAQEALFQRKHGSK